MLKTTLAVLLLFTGMFQQAPRQIIDNERVTVWDATWMKGKPTSHQNKYDQVTVELADSSIRITTPDGKAKSSSLKFGQATFVPKGSAQIEEGTSEAGRHAIVIDLKDTVVPPMENKSGYPDAFPREGIKKLVDNARVTVWDYTWTPGKATPMHFHAKDVVTIYMATGEIRSTPLTGEATVNVVSPGVAKFNARNRTHTEELIKGMGRAIIVELK
jgi:quercetin dioxygenase-like cupin family protein